MVESPHSTEPSQWYLFAKDQHKGPYETQYILQSLAQKEISPETFVWRPGLEDWITVAQAFPQAQTAPPTPPPSTAVEDFFSDLPRESGLRELAFGRAGKDLGPPPLPTASAESSGELDEGPPPLPPLPPEDPAEDAPLELQEFPIPSGDETQQMVDSAVEPPEKPLSDEDLQEIITLSKQKTSTEQLKIEAPGEAVITFGEGEITEKTNTQLSISLPEIQAGRQEGGGPRGRLLGSLLKFSKALLRPLLLLLLPLSLLAGIFYLYLIFFHAKLPDRPRGLSSAKYQKMLQAMERPLEEKLAVEAASSPQGSKVWIASNFPNNVLLKVTLTAVEGKVLAREPIQLESQGELRNHLAELGEFKLVAGKARKPGFYQMEIVSQQVLPFKSWFRRLWAEFQGTHELRELRFKKIFFWGSDKTHEENFKERLEQFQQYHVGQQSRHFDFLFETYSTLIKLLREGEYLYFQSLKSMTLGKRDINRFKDPYMQRVGTPLTQLLTNTDKIATQLQYQKSSLAPDYQKLEQFHKELGALFAQVITETQNSTVLGKRTQKKLRELFTPQFRALEEKMEQAREGINREIKKIKLGL